MTTPENCSNEQDKDEAVCYSKLAREGISLLLNNKQDEAETLFKNYPQSIQMNAGLAFAMFTDALMTFEDDKLEIALQTLKDLEKKCSACTSWMRSVKCRMFGSDAVSYAEQLESQIILADSFVFVATLTFLQQDISGYFKGGWILRKSYKHYQHAYNEILTLYNEIVGDNNIPVQPCQQGILSPEVSSDIKDIAVLETHNNESLSPAFEELPNATVSDATEDSIANSESSKDNEITTDTLTETPAPTSPILEGLKGISSDLNQKPTSSLYSKNGYVLSSFANKISFPKHSISCHGNLSNISSHIPRERSLKNGYVKDRKDHARSAALQIRPFLKKSTSVNSALSESTDRRLSFGSNISLSYFTSTFSIFNNRPITKDIDKETISRLLCAVSFGYGLLQLGISLLPPSMLKLTSFLGFGGNRKNGLENLMFARLGSDMRAPFATLTLLWYHTIVRPFFALDGNNVQAGVEAAAQLIEETTQVYSQSALFLFFKGRVERLNSNISKAITAFQASIENAAQREIKMMSLHEVGWCYLIQLDFAKSESTFNSLKQSSRWSRPFYSYLTIISAGSNHKFQNTDDVSELRSIFPPVPKGTQLDEFLNRRYKICPVEQNVLKQTSCLFWKLLVYELLYLWNTLPSCTNESIQAIICDCESATEIGCESMVGLAKLIEGSCLCILRRFNEGVDSFRICLENRKNLPSNSDAAHISAFAQYELGLLLIRNEQTLDEGKKLLQLAAYNYKDYDFEQRLSVRVHAILKSL